MTLLLRNSRMLEPRIFDYLTDQFGRPENDMFASMLNKQIQLYASCYRDPGSSLIDAFSINWNHMFVYAFPSCCIIWRVLQQMTQSWFTSIMELAILPPIIIPIDISNSLGPKSNIHSIRIFKCWSY